MSELKLSESTCDGLRNVRTEIRETNSKAITTLGQAVRELEDADNEAAADLAEILEGHLFEDNKATEGTIVDVLEMFCEEGARDRNAAVEIMT